MVSTELLRTAPVVTAHGDGYPRIIADHGIDKQNTAPNVLVQADKDRGKDIPIYLQSEFHKFDEILTEEVGNILNNYFKVCNATVQTIGQDIPTCSFGMLKRVYHEIFTLWINTNEKKLILLYDYEALKCGDFVSRLKLGSEARRVEKKQVRGAKHNVQKGKHKQIRSTMLRRMKAHHTLEKLESTVISLIRSKGKGRIAGYLKKKCRHLYKQLRKYVGSGRSLYDERSRKLGPLMNGLPVSVIIDLVCSRGVSEKYGKGRLLQGLQDLAWYITGSYHSDAFPCTEVLSQIQFLETFVLAAWTSVLLFVTACVLAKLQEKSVSGDLDKIYKKDFAKAHTGVNALCFLSGGVSTEDGIQRDKLRVQDKSISYNTNDEVCAFQNKYSTTRLNPRINPLTKKDKLKPTLTSFNSTINFSEVNQQPEASQGRSSIRINTKEIQHALSVAEASPHSPNHSQSIIRPEDISFLRLKPQTVLGAEAQGFPTDPSLDPKQMGWLLRDFFTFGMYQPQWHAPASENPTPPPLAGERLREAMRQSNFRIASFIHLRDQLDVAEMVDAGLYLDEAEEDIIRCYLCSFRVPRDQWPRDRHPRDVHQSTCPDCPLFHKDRSTRSTGGISGAGSTESLNEQVENASIQSSSIELQDQLNESCTQSAPTSVMEGNDQDLSEQAAAGFSEAIPETGSPSFGPIGSHCNDNSIDSGKGDSIQDSPSERTDGVGSMRQKGPGQPDNGCREVEEENRTLESIEESLEARESSRDESHRDTRQSSEEGHQHEQSTHHCATPSVHTDSEHQASSANLGYPTLVSQEATCIRLGKNAFRDRPPYRADLQQDGENSEDSSENAEEWDVGGGYDDILMLTVVNISGCSLEDW